MRKLLFSSVLALLVAAGCGHNPGMVTQVTPMLIEPLDPAVALVVTPPKSGLLGAVYDGRSAAGAHSLADLGVRFRDNPCAEHLLEHDEDAKLRATEVWSPTDPVFPELGFAPYAAVTTHLFVHVESSKVRAVTEGEGYAECCAQAQGACGDGLVSAVYEGRIDVHPATMLSNASPPVVLISPQGQTMGFGLHEGHSHTGVVAVELD